MSTQMIDVGNKPDTQRLAHATGQIHLKKETLSRIRNQEIEKGDVLSVARIAGIMAAKKCSEFVPLCHPLLLSSIQIELTPYEDYIQIDAIVKVTGKTGVEMEALTAVSASALTIYDMCKSIDKTMRIDAIQLMEKQGGRSGHFRHPDIT